MGVVTLGIALGYLLVLAAVAVGTLLVQLFGDAPGESKGNEVETVEDWRGVADDLPRESVRAPPAELGSAEKTAA